MFEQNPSANDLIVLGPTTTIEGEIRTPNKVVIGGVYRGLIDAHTVVILPGAELEGEIKAEYLEISGSVNGKVYSKKQVIIRQQGELSGWIVHAAIIIEQGSKVSAELVRDTDFYKPQENLTRKFSESTKSLVKPHQNEAKVSASAELSAKVPDKEPVTDSDDIAFNRYQEEVSVAGKHEINVSLISYDHEQEAQTGLVNWLADKLDASSPVTDKGWVLPLNFGIPNEYIDSLVSLNQVPTVYEKLIEANGKYLVIRINSIRGYTPPSFEEVRYLYQGVTS